MNLRSLQCSLWLGVLLCGRGLSKDLKTNTDGEVKIPIRDAGGGMALDSFVPANFYGSVPECILRAMSSPYYASSANERMPAVDCNLITRSKIVLRGARLAEGYEIQIDLSDAKKHESDILELPDLINGIITCLRAPFAVSYLVHGPMAVKIIGASDASLAQTFDGPLWKTDTRPKPDDPPVGTSFISVPRPDQGQLDFVWVPLSMEEEMTILRVPALLFGERPGRIVDVIGRPVYAISDQPEEPKIDRNLVTKANIVLRCVKRGKMDEIQIDLSHAHRPQPEDLDLFDVTEGVVMSLRLYYQFRIHQPPPSVKIIGAKTPAFARRFDGPLWRTGLSK